MDAINKTLVPRLIPEESAAPGGQQVLVHRLRNKLRSLTDVLLYDVFFYESEKSRMNKVTCSRAPPTLHSVVVDVKTSLTSKGSAPLLLH